MLFDYHLALLGAWLSPKLCWLIRHCIDYFCFVWFDLLQTLFRLEPILGPLGLGVLIQGQTKPNKNSVYNAYQNIVPLY